MTTNPFDNPNKENEEEKKDSLLYFDHSFKNIFHKLDVSTIIDSVNFDSKSEEDKEYTSNTESTIQRKRILTKAIWNVMKKKSKNLYSPSSCNDHFTKIDPNIFQTLTSIRILDYDSLTQHTSWLNTYNGEIYPLPMDFLHLLQQKAPTTFHARVADFNNNLFYDIQEQCGLKHLLIQNNNDDDIIVNNNNMTSIKSDCTSTSSSTCCNLDTTLTHILDSNTFLGSFLATESTTPQPPHVDFTWERLKQHGHNLRIGFFPLTQDGMFLQVWKRNDNFQCKDIQGEIIFIPFGTLLTLPSDTIHGGGFRTTPIICNNEDDSDNDKYNNASHNHHINHGNLRFHLYIAYNEAQLSKTQTTNKYTEPGDKTKELADRYIDAPAMKELRELLFTECH